MPEVNFHGHVVECGETEGEGPLFVDRQTDILLTERKVNPDLFVIEIEICTCIYNIVNLLKSCRRWNT